MKMFTRSIVLISRPRDSSDRQQRVNHENSRDNSEEQSHENWGFLKGLDSQLPTENKKETYISL